MAKAETAKRGTPPKERKKKKPADVKLHQGWLADGDKSMKPKRFPDLDKALEAVLDCDEQIAINEAERKINKARVDELMRKHKIEGSYFYDFGLLKYDSKLGKAERKLSITKVPDKAKDQ